MRGSDSSWVLDQVYRGRSCSCCGNTKRSSKLCTKAMQTIEVPSWGCDRLAWRYDALHDMYICMKISETFGYPKLSDIGPF